MQATDAKAACHPEVRRSRTRRISTGGL